MSAAEFERAYAKRAGMTVAQLRGYGRVVLPCRCGEDGCEGWQSISRELADDPLVRRQAGLGLQSAGAISVADDTARDHQSSAESSPSCSADPKEQT